MLITDGIQRLVGSRESVIAIYMGYVSSSAANDETQSKSHHIEARRAYDSLFFFLPPISNTMRFVTTRRFDICLFGYY